MKLSRKELTLSVVLALIACFCAEAWLTRIASPQIAARYYSRNRTNQFFERSAAQSRQPHQSHGRQIRFDHEMPKR